MKPPSMKGWALGALVVVLVGVLAYLNRPLEGLDRRPAPAKTAELPVGDAPAPTPAPVAEAKPPEPKPMEPYVTPAPKPADTGRSAVAGVDLPTNPNTLEAPPSATIKEYRRAGKGPVLADCAASHDPNDLCAFTQPRFLTDWTKAQDGDINAARRLALCIGSGCSGAVKPTPIEGCAWSLLIDRVRRGLDETDKAYVAMACSELKKDKMEAAYDRAGEISSEVHLRDGG